MHDLGQKTIFGALANVLCPKRESFHARRLSHVGSAVWPERLSISGYGHVCYGGPDLIFRDFGLSSGAISAQTVAEEQISTLLDPGVGKQHEKAGTGKLLAEHRRD